LLSPPPEYGLQVEAVDVSAVADNFSHTRNNKFLRNHFPSQMWPPRNLILGGGRETYFEQNVFN
jgi:hypothetical protein